MTIAGEGFLAMLSRGEARDLFARQEDQDIHEFVRRLIGAEELHKEQRVLELDTTWDAIHRVLTDGRLDADAGDYPLNHAILGGRQLFHGDRFIASLKRPDMTPHIADALEKADEAQLRERFMALDATDYGHPPDPQEWERVWSELGAAAKFYRRAADEEKAVLFAAPTNAE